MPKYMRIQGREIAFKTQKPCGLFALSHRKIRDGIYSDQDKQVFTNEDTWFQANLPIPPFYNENYKENIIPITYFKTECSKEMKNHIKVIVSLFDKYKIPYDVIFTDYVGKIIYEDEFQIGCIDPVIDIKPIKHNELPNVLELIHKSFSTVAANFNFTYENCPNHTSFMPYKKLETFYNQGFLMYGLYEDEKLSGYVSLAKQQDGQYDLNNLAVLPQKRHLGYGKKLVNFCKQKAKELKAQKIKIGIIEDSQIIKNFYENLGFIHIGTQKFEHLPFTVGYMEYNLE